MLSWDINNVKVDPYKPVVLDSEDEGRAILIQLPAGESLQDHQVHERAWLLVSSGEIVIDADGERATGGAGFLTIFDPNERREITAKSDARLLLLLSPWPGKGHPSEAG